MTDWFKPSVAKRDEYVVGPHHFWIHFWCGLVFGVVFGAWIAFGIFENGWVAFVLTIALALLVAYCCGRWGDPAWRWFIKMLG